jgi:arylsulfatase A-like enzyme
MARMRVALRTLPIALLGLAACGAGGAGGSTPRHLILVTIDTLRADHLGCYGSKRATTSAAGAAARGSAPGFTIDEIAAQGVRFENAFAPRGMTLPSLSTVLTGRPPIETCVLDNRNALPPGAATLAEALRQSGFRTAAFSANRLLAPGSGFDQGFETFVQDPAGDRDVAAVKAAEDWLAAQDPDGGSRLFLWLHLVGPHLPYAPEPIEGVDFARLFDDPGYAGAADGSREFLDKAYGEGRALTPAELAHVVALYDGEVARIDHLVSRFLAFCAGKDPRAGADRLSQSLLVFAADHGEELYERSRYFGHAKSVYASVLHVPLVLRHPATLGAGRVVPDLVGLEDLMPTVLELVGLPPPRGTRGRSLAPLARGAGALPPEPQFGMWRDRMYSVRSGRWRLVWNPDRAVSDDVPPGPYPVPEIALFDVAIDPSEVRDVAAEHPDVVAELERATRTWLADLHPCTPGAVGPTPEQIRAMRDLGYAGEDR